MRRARAGRGTCSMRAILAIAAILSVAQTSSDRRLPTGQRIRQGPHRDRHRHRREAGAILTEQCVACHGPEKKKGGLDLSRRSSALAGGESGAAIVPGRPAESLLVEKVADGEMPPKGALSKDEVAAVRAWVEAGAPYPSEPLSPAQGRRRLVVAPADPIGRPARGARGRRRVGSRTPVDAFVLARLDADGLRPAPEADRGQPHPPRHVRPHRPAADARAGRRLRERPEPPGLRGARRAAAGVPPLRRALGPALAGCRPVRRERGLRDQPAAARRVALSRLRDPRLQPRHAVPPVRPRATRRRYPPRRRGMRLADPGRDRVPGGRHARHRRQPDRRGDAPATRRRPGRHDHGDRHHLPGADRPVRAVPRPQVRPDHPARLLQPPGGLRWGRPRPARGRCAGFRVAAARGDGDRRRARRHRSPPRRDRAPGQSRLR